MPDVWFFMQGSSAGGNLRGALLPPVDAAVCPEQTLLLRI